MTKDTYEKAKEYLSRIEDVRKLRKYVFSNPMLTESRDSLEHIYLSWADNEDGELKQTIIDWCDSEIKKLQTIFDEL